MANFWKEGELVYDREADYIFKYKKIKHLELMIKFPNNYRKANKKDKREEPITQSDSLIIQKSFEEARKFDKKLKYSDFLCEEGHCSRRLCNLLNSIRIDTYEDAVKLFEKGKKNFNHYRNAGRKNWVEFAEIMVKIKEQEPIDQNDLLIIDKILTSNLNHLEYRLDESKRFVEVFNIVDEDVIDYTLSLPVSFFDKPKNPHQKSWIMPFQKGRWSKDGLVEQKYKPKMVSITDKVIEFPFSEIIDVFLEFSNDENKIGKIILTINT